jgi:Tfp pilus assembly protein PilV
VRSSSRGFTLLEALLAGLIMSGALLSLVFMQVTFCQQNIDRKLQNTLLDAASGAVSQCKSGITPPASVTIDSVVVLLARSGSCTPASGSCSDVTITASSGSRNYVLVTKICSF